MNLGVLLSIGGSLSDYNKNGQMERLLFYLEKYKKCFEKIYIFSYLNEEIKLPVGCILVPNKYKIHRYVYSLLLPLLEKSIIKKCNIFRVTQITGSTPALLIKIFYGIPYISTYGFDYSSFASLEGQKIISKFINFLKPFWLSQADKIIITNRKIQDGLGKIVNKEKLVYVPNGVDTNIFKFTVKKMTDHSIKILFVGRLVKQKNLENLINAVNISSNKNRIKLLFVGEGPEKEKLQRVSTSLKVNLLITPFRQLKELPKVYQESDIFVLPSLIEGHPKVLLEAASCGLPVVATSVEGITEIIKNNYNGLLANPNDAINLASKIDKIISDKLFADKLAKNGRKTIVANYSLSNLLDKEVQVLAKSAIESPKEI